MLTFIRGINDGGRHKRALYRCDCGNETVAIENNVRIGHTTSCGCARKESVRERSTTHGHRADRTKVYVAWLNMKGRCDNPQRDDYGNYGGRGITYDPRWALFENFLADMGEPAYENLSLDREDNDKGYSKDNCRWATRTMQNKNRRNNVFYTLNGESHTLSDWSKINGIGRLTMLKRIQAGVPLEIALTQKGFCGYRRDLKRSVQ